MIKSAMQIILLISINFAYAMQWNTTIPSVDLKNDPRFIAEIDKIEKKYTQQLFNKEQEVQIEITKVKSKYTDEIHLKDKEIKNKNQLIDKITTELNLKNDEIKKLDNCLEQKTLSNNILLEQVTELKHRLQQEQNEHSNLLTQLSTSDLLLKEKDQENQRLNNVSSSLLKEKEFFQEQSNKLGESLKESNIKNKECEELKNKVFLLKEDLLSLKEKNYQFIEKQQNKVLSVVEQLNNLKKDNNNNSDTISFALEILKFINTSQTNDSDLAEIIHKIKKNDAKSEKDNKGIVLTPNDKDIEEIDFEIVEK